MLPSVFVVDDNHDLCNSLAMVLELAGYPARAFTAPRQFQSFYRPQMPGCLLLDIQMPGQTGLELYAQLLAEGKRLPVIFMTAHANISTAVAAMKTGAIEFLEKPFEHSTLLPRVERALQLDAQWRSRDEDFQRIDERIQHLTRRELETLQMIIAGEPNKRIASRLSLTERAVEKRRAAIMRKLGVNSLAELLDLAVTHRLLAEVRRAAQQHPFAAY